MSNEDDLDDPSDDELDDLIEQYLAERAWATDEDHAKMRQFLAEYEASAAASPFSLPQPPRCTKEEARTTYSKQAERELIAASRRIAHDDYEDQKLSHHRSLWPQVREACKEKHQKRRNKIEIYFKYKRTGRHFF